MVGPPVQPNRRCPTKHFTPLTHLHTPKSYLQLSLWSSLHISCKLRYSMDLATMSRSIALRASKQVRSARYYSIVHDVPRNAASLSQNSPPPQPQSQSIFDQAVNATGPRHNWTKEEISQIHQRPLMELAFAAVSCDISIHIWA